MKISKNNFDLLEYLPYKLNDIAQRSALLLAAQYKHLGISRPQFHVMAFVSTYPGISPKEVIKMTIMDKSRVTRSIDGLVEKGLLTRKVNPEDKRKFLLSLTPQGEKMYIKISTMAGDLQHGFSSSLSKEEKAVLDRALIKMDAVVNQISAKNRIGEDN